jgi:ankyrin repeat protein
MSTLFIKSLLDERPPQHARPAANNNNPTWDAVRKWDAEGVAGIGWCADRLTRDENGMTPLLFVCFHGMEDMLRVMWDHEAPDAYAECLYRGVSHTPFSVAANRGNIRCVRYLADRAHGRARAIREAVRCGQLETLRLLSCTEEPWGVPTDLHDLWVFAWESNAPIDMLSWLLSEGANPNALVSGSPVLFTALGLYDSARVRLLLRYGADAAVVDCRRRQPLRFLAEYLLGDRPDTVGVPDSNVLGSLFDLLFVSMRGRAPLLPMPVGPASTLVDSHYARYSRRCANKRQR